MRFNSDKFSFNGIHCKTKNISLLWGDNDFIEYGLSFNQSVEYNDLTWKTYQDKPNTILLHMVYEKNDVPQAWTHSKISDIESWLITDDFTPFISDDNKDIVYYLKVVNIVRRFNHEMKGWLEVEFQPFSNYGYILQDITLKNASRFLKLKNVPSMSIVNSSSLNKPSYPIVKIKGLNGELFINNLTTGKTFSLNAHGNITIDNKMKTITNENGDNLLQFSNREWLYFIQGNNKIQVLGDCDITFMSQYEVRV